MNFSDYLKLILRNKLLIIIVAVFSVAAAYFYSTTFNSNPYQSTLFLTFGIQDKAISPTTSTYENLEAADQITESIQGWFKDPGFTNQITQTSQLNYPINAKKQEKNNLIIEFNSPDLTSAQHYSDSIVSSLNQRLLQYNSKSDLQINIATSTLDNQRSANRIYLILAVALGIGLIIGFLASLLWELTHGLIQSNQQIEGTLHHKILATYKNDRVFKKTYFFLCKFLNEHYSNQPLQIIDLTHKSKFGVETISKHTELKEIKTIKLPTDFSSLSLTTPTLIIAELGYSKQTNLEELKNFHFNQLQIISLEKIRR